MVERSRYLYDANYPYLKFVVENTGLLRYDARVAIRDWLRVSVSLGLKPGNRILDVGCCIGTLGHYLKYGGVSTYGIDINPAAIKKGHEIFGIESSNTSIIADGMAIPYQTDYFDAVASQDVFEHFSNLDCARKALQEMDRVLKPNQKMFHKITVLEETSHIHNDPSHRIKQTTDEWLSFFATNGWETIKNPTRHFPIKSSLSYGNFLLSRKR
ncbi:hypothetical protein A2Z22_03825 [Candidatus Woesebacteria bacterium RBG_16_34_12]|uniref:Methyltransferase type 11 domain-containing protein n=1 Tax=Candidatus Woesebacteria bacterium RBG_16_34_12 TaxID=1802480 RepID=A0A1F7X869_9BACT|nr:MAG: hypothetical protein A2Z22_03825 [Candidatus Woesebacteria bacterium RBG_16_34_12]